MSGEQFVDPMAGTMTGQSQNLSSWAAPYVTDMLGKGQALSNMPFTAYSGPLTAGQSGLQNTAFQGLANLTMPTNMGTFTPQSFTGMAPTAPTAMQAAQQPMQQSPPSGMIGNIISGWGPNGESGTRQPDGSIRLLPQQPMAQPFKDLITLPDFLPEEVRQRTEQEIFALPDDYRGEAQFTGLGSFAGKEGVLGPDDSPIGETRPVTREDIERFRANFQPGGLGGVSMPAGTTQQQPMQQQPMAQQMMQQQPMQQQPMQQQPMQQSPIEQYMSPYLQGALQPQYDAANRQAQIAAQNLQSQYGKAGAYGGSRQGVAEAELQRGLLDRMAGITGKGYQDAFTQGLGQFNVEQNRAQQAQTLANQYGFDVLGAQQTAGATQRGIEGEGIAADYGQFKEERDYPLAMTKYQKSLIEGLPITTTDYALNEPEGYTQVLGGLGGILKLLQDLRGE